MRLANPYKLKIAVLKLAYYTTSCILLVFFKLHITAHKSFVMQVIPNQALKYTALVENYIRHGRLNHIMYNKIANT